MNFNIQELVETVQKNHELLEEERKIRRHKRFQGKNEQWCKDNNLQYKERYTLPLNFYSMTPSEQDEAIVTLIKDIFPDKIDNSIYHFPHQWFYCITDKNYYFTLRKTPRHKTKEEVKEIQKLRDEVISKSRDKRIQYLIGNGFEKSFSSITDDDEWIKKMNQIQIDFQCKEEAEKYKYLYGNDEEKVKEHLQILVDDYYKSRDELYDYVNAVDDACEKEAVYELFIHSQDSKQVSIYLSGDKVSIFRSLGYKIYEYPNQHTNKVFSLEYLNYQFETIYTKHECIKIDFRVFVSSCKHRKLFPMGKYLDDDGKQLTIQRGRTKGCNNKHLAKPFSLKNQENDEVLKFETMQCCASHFQMDKGNLSKKLKGLNDGDTVKLKKVEYKYFI